jgi:hypothetical protein
MSFNDFHHNFAVVRGIEPIAVGTTGTGKTTAAIDRRGYGGVEFLFEYGTVTATNAVFTVLLTEADTTGGSFTSVADADMLGSEALAGLAATTPRVSGVSKNVKKKLGYIGGKNYVKAKLSSTITAGTPVSITALLWASRHMPVA